MQTIPNLELHVAHGCNLSCESCSHYSNQGHKGMLSLAEAEDWMRQWAGRLAPRTLSLLGGEPSIHPQLPAFLELARRYFPKTHLRLVTNGFFLHRHPELPAVMARDPDACLDLSVHHDSPEYREKLEPIYGLLKSWVAQHGIRVQVYLSHKRWTRRYHGSGSAMAPFDDGQPRRSWEHCPAKHCMQLHQGQLWKCAPLAYLHMQDDKYGLSDAWAPYLAYRPLAAGCSDAELAQFAGREHEDACGMCPARPERLALPYPLKTAAALRAVGIEAE
ncbi:MAG TPA: radical SAM protein [Ramlibacter sp.]|nr:radical SAM protein [Ramlibacter sp.]